MRLLIVIVNYRSADFTVDCLRTLDSEVRALDQARVVVVDACSNDGSVNLFRQKIDAEGWHDWARVQELDRNGGFAYGNNAAIRTALAGADQPDYVMLLNPDTLVRPNALASLLNFMDSHPQVGIAGSRLEDSDGSSQWAARRFPSVLGEFEGALAFGPVSRLLSQWVMVPPDLEITEPYPTDWIVGAGMIIRREVFEAIGLLDESYFMYFEEVDFCFRARRAGWSCWYVPSSRIVHLVGKSSGVTERGVIRRRPRYWFDSRRRYFIKNRGRVYALLADLAWICGYSLFRLRALLSFRRVTSPPWLLWDFIRGSSFSFGNGHDFVS